MPPAFAAAYPGPRFGIAGTRRLAGVEGRPADRHHHQAERRARPRGDGGARRRALRRRHRFHQGRRVAVGRPDLSVRRARPRRHARHRRRGRPHRQEDHVRLQPHRRPRSDAAASRHAARERRHLPDGEPELGRAGRHDRARPLQRSCRSTRTATAGAIFRAIRCSAGPTPPGKSSGGWRAPTTCMSTACRTSSPSRTRA